MTPPLELALEPLTQHLKKKMRAQDSRAEFGVCVCVWIHVCAHLGMWDIWRGMGGNTGGE